MHAYRFTGHFSGKPRVNQLPLDNLTRDFGASFTGLMCFLMSTGRSMLGFIFSPSNTTPERESSVTPFCTGSRRPVPQIMATNSGCKNIVISKKCSLLLIISHHSVVKVTTLHPVNLSSTPTDTQISHWWWWQQDGQNCSYMPAEVLSVLVGTTDALNKGLNDVKFRWTLPSRSRPSHSPSLTGQCSAPFNGSSARGPQLWAVDRTSYTIYRYCHFPFRQ